MITEDALRDLLAQAADSAPPPGGLPEGLLEGLGEATAPVPDRRFAGHPRRLLAVAAAAVIVVGLVAALVGGGDDPVTTASDTTSEAGTTGGGDGFAATTVPGLADSAGPSAPGSDPQLLETVAPDADVASRNEAAGGGTAASQLQDSAQVVKTGSVTLEVDEGAYDRSVDLLTTKVAGMGGYVSQSSTSRTDDRPAGSLVLRVPAARFDQLMVDLRKLGKVVDEDSQGVDVGGQVADLDARLSALRATRDKLTAILAKAGSVDETLTVQDRITGVQTQIEQLEGQQRLLQDQVQMSSITVSLAEPGAERIALATDERDLGGAWDDARHRFGDGIEDLVAWSGSAAVVVLVGAAALFALRLAWPRLRRLLL